MTFFLTPENPSAWTHRSWLLLLCVCGAAVSGYLTAVQLHWVATAWDPLFGRGSEHVLFSSWSRRLPIPDASVGLMAYVTEAACTLIGSRDRWRTRRAIVFVSGAVMASAGLGSLGLISLQAFVIHQGCFFCLISAAISLVLCVLAAPEVRLAWRSYVFTKTESPSRHLRGIHET